MMFDSLKIYKHKAISIEAVCQALSNLNYSGGQGVNEAGDFAQKGDTLEVFPANFTLPLRIEWDFDKISKIYSFDQNFSKILEYDLLIIVPYFKKRRHYDSEDYPLEGSLRIAAGDYVVHTHYGIGKFLGTKKIKAKEKEEYFFQIEYADKDLIYVSKENAHLIQKYINLGIKKPALTKLGTKQWKKVKAKVEKGIRHYALSILKIEAQRKLIGGIKYPNDSKWQRKFETQFSYQLTPDQEKAAKKVKEEMQSSKCMDRLLCGGVGYGKTEVAMRAAFRAAASGRQVAFLVPTTILAYQHYISLQRRMQDFPLCVEMLSRFCTRSEQQNIAQRIRAGKVDIVVGTHRLLSKDINFKDLGLLIIDEEQRFGVEHKDKIKSRRVGIDVLSLTATPIPRTLYMSMVGIKDVSLIQTPPKERLSIKTKVYPFSLKVIKEAITRELNRGGQVFFIHNRIKDIDKIAKKVKNNLPKIKAGLAHGRLPAQDIENVMLEFVDGKIDVLFSTAIVESGIDIPNANTIIINNANNFGLADLHQLRGRVGRRKIQAYALCLRPPLDKIKTESRKRLEFIEEFSHLGAGFELARRDLELRGAGNILGKQQHGFVWMVGFDFYCRLLKKEVDYLKEAFKM
ncbi:MAG: DEAD/DEAH box helicase [Candidatus Omnitrophica bacterium]|nr:DEAD/DEAH box helicase [Candidatus Omnitrophota bacterium]